MIRQPPPPSHRGTPWQTPLTFGGAHRKTKGATDGPLPMLVTRQPQWERHSASSPGGGVQSAVGAIHACPRSIVEMEADMTEDQGQPTGMSPSGTDRCSSIATARRSGSFKTPRQPTGRCPGRWQPSRRPRCPGPDVARRPRSLLSSRCQGLLFRVLRQFRGIVGHRRLRRVGRWRLRAR